MAGTVTHLVIADKLLSYLDIKNPALFYCGNLAPDAVMAREGYVREMKKHSHFRDDIPTNDFHLEKYYHIYRKRLEAFKEKYLDKESRDYEWYLGYTAHILADEVFILTLRDRHVKKLIDSGRSASDKDYFAVFGHDVDLNDWRLVREYNFHENMPEVLRRADGIDMGEYVTLSELKSSKEFIINKNFVQKHEKESPQVFQFEENEVFIRNAVKFIEKNLI